MLAVTRLLHHMSRVFRDNSVPKSRPGGIQIDRKRLKKLQVRYGTVSAPTNPRGLRQSIYESMDTLRHTAIRSEGHSISDRAPGSTVSFYANTEEAKKIVYR